MRALFGLHACIRAKGRSPTGSLWPLLARGELLARECNALEAPGCCQTPCRGTLRPPLLRLLRCVPRAASLRTHISNAVQSEEGQDRLEELDIPPDPPTPLPPPHGTYLPLPA